MNKKRFALKVIFTLAFFMMLVQNVAANQKLTLMLDWFPNPNHAPIFVAKQQGFFEKHGLDVKIITPADPSDPPRWVALGKSDLALDYQMQALLQMARGLPIKQVGTLINQPLNCLVVLASSPITKLEELRGKKIAYSAPEVDLAILKAMLDARHLSIKEVQPINVHYDLMQALLSKRVAAAIGMMRNIELTQLKSLGEQGRAFFPEDYVVPAYSELIFIASSNMPRERFIPFFQALNEAGAYLRAHPEMSWNLFALHQPELNTSVYQKVWKNTLPRFAIHFEAIDMTQCQKLVAFLKSELHIDFKADVCRY